MSIQSMQDTRREGEIQRLETVSALVEEAQIKPLTPRRFSELVNNAVQSATGLKAESSRKTFKYECELVLDPRVMRNWHSILKISEEIWQNGRLKFHSKYHVVIKICEKIRGGRRADPIDFAFVEKHYAEHGTLPP